MFRILMVCTANICRSPATAALLRIELIGRGISDGVQIESAGVYAVDGSPACDVSAALVNGVASYGHDEPDRKSPLEAHKARRVTSAMVQEADLVIALDRGHRSELARLASASRPRTFTLRQSAVLSRVVAGYLSAGELPPGSSPLMPIASEARLRWWVEELDAVRGVAPRAPEPTAAASEDPTSWHPDDVPDPHVRGSQIHGAVLAMEHENVQEIASAMSQVLAFEVLAAGDAG